MRMRSLFIKIFLWFWLAIITVATTAVVAVYLFHAPDDTEVSRWRSVAGQTLAPQARAAIDVLERDGEDALFEHLDHQDAAAGTHTFLLDAAGRDLGGHRPPRPLAELADRVRAGGAGQVTSDSKKTMVAITATGTKGASYVFAREMLLNSERFRGPPPLAGSLDDEEAYLDEFDGPPDGPPPGRPGPDGPHGPPRHRPPPGRGPPPGPDGPDALGKFLTEPQTLAAILGAIVAAGGIVCYALARYLTRPVRLLRGAARSLAEGDLAARVGTAAGRRRDEIGELAHDFDFMAERLESLVVAQKRLLQDISHELRSPLARLNVALELAGRDAGPPAAPALARVAREAERLNDLIGRLLVLTRMEAGASPPHPVRVDLRELVQEVAADADFEATARNRRVRVLHCDSCETMGTPDLLSSAVENILRNAVQYTAEKTAVEVSLHRTGTAADAHACIEIRDHGPGVPEPALAEIFRPFYRVAETRDHNADGVGLGLAIADRAIRLHGGAIQAINATDGGLIVQIRIKCTATSES